MRLRKPCPHKLYDEHPWDDFGEVAVFTCPGGVFLAEDALVIEKDSLGDWPGWASQIIVDLISEGETEPYLAVMLSVGILDALAVRDQT